MIFDIFIDILGNSPIGGSSGSVDSAENGTYLDGTTVKLGGNLTEQTDIDCGSYGINFQEQGSSTRYTRIGAGLYVRTVNGQFDYRGGSSSHYTTIRGQQSNAKFTRQNIGHGEHGFIGDSDRFFYRDKRSGVRQTGLEYENTIDPANYSGFTMPSWENVQNKIDEKIAEIPSPESEVLVDDVTIEYSTGGDEPNFGTEADPLDNITAMWGDTAPTNFDDYGCGATYSNGIHTSGNAWGNESVIICFDAGNLQAGTYFIWTSEDIVSNGSINPFSGFTHVGSTVADGGFKHEFTFDGITPNTTGVYFDGGTSPQFTAKLYGESAGGGGDFGTEATELENIEAMWGDTFPTNFDDQGVGQSFSAGEYTSGNTYGVNYVMITFDTGDLPAGTYYIWSSADLSANGGNPYAWDSNWTYVGTTPADGGFKHEFTFAGGSPLPGTGIYLDNGSSSGGQFTAKIYNVNSGSAGGIYGDKSDLGELVEQAWEGSGIATSGIWQGSLASGVMSSSGGSFGGDFSAGASIQNGTLSIWCSHDILTDGGYFDVWDDTASTNIPLNSVTADDGGFRYDFDYDNGIHGDLGMFAMGGVPYDFTMKLYLRNPTGGGGAEALTIKGIDNILHSGDAHASPDKELASVAFIYDLLGIPY